MKQRSFANASQRLVPAFAVRRLPSDLLSPAAPLPLANGLWQLAHKGFSPFRNIRYPYTGSNAHAGHPTLSLIKI
jgi:hypothetical protein